MVTPSAASQPPSGGSAGVVVPQKIQHGVRLVSRDSASRTIWGSSTMWFFGRERDGPIATVFGIGRETGPVGHGKEGSTSSSLDIVNERKLRASEHT